VGPRTGLDDVEERNILPLPGLDLQPFGRRARSQSLYPTALSWLPWHKYKQINVDINRRNRLIIQ
jgi:hypothetical protein